MKYIIITGVNGHLGKCYADYLISKEFNVIGIDKSASSMVKNIKYYSGDVLDERLWDQIIAENKELELYALINNAAYTNNSRVESMSQYDELKEYLNINLVAAYMGCQKLIDFWVSKNYSGRIINVGSLYSELSPTPRMYLGTDVIQPIGYTISKHAVTGLTKYLAAHYGHLGILCNTLSPGGVFFGHKDPFYSRFIEQIPIKSMSEVQDLYPGLDFLLDERNVHLTGQNIKIDGGWSII